jgi:hypothetical protein
MFRYNRRTLDCYGKRWGIPVRFVDPKDVSKGVCTKHQDWFFRRVCVQAAIVESLLMTNVGTNTEGDSLFDLKLAKAPKWIIFFDGDTIVTNNNVSIAKVAEEWGDKHLVFYERFHDGEIMAGNFAVRVSHTVTLTLTLVLTLTLTIIPLTLNPKGTKFLRGWEAMSQLAKRVPFSNSDNGALHLY